MTPYYTTDLVELYLGDCREVLPDLSIDRAVVVTDPPYGETALPWDRWPTGWIDTIPVEVRQMWCFGSMRMFLSQLPEFAAWTFAQEVVWEKHNGSGFLADRFKRVHELATHWYRGPWSDLTIVPQYVPEAQRRTVRKKARPAQWQGATGSSTYTSVDGGPKMQRSVIYVRSMHGRALHPTEKPIGIVEPLVRYSTTRDDLVLDPFAGSGAVLDVARVNGRRAIGVEADERYCEVIARRLDQGVLPL